MSTSSTETAPTIESSSENESQTHLEQLGQMALAQQGRAMADLAADRCLLRRNTKALQNERYGLGQDNLPECEEDMGVHVGDQTDNSKTIHNHYHGTCPDDPPHPHPHPHPGRRMPWWLIALLVIPWIVLATILVAWVLSNWNTNPRPPVVWELDIDSENPQEIEE